MRGSRWQRSQETKEEGPRTHDHARADVAEFGLFAVVVLELVGPVVDRFDQRWRSFVLLLLLHFFVVNEVHLQEPGRRFGGKREQKPEEMRRSEGKTAFGAFFAVLLCQR